MFCEMEGFISGQQFKKLYEKKCEPLMKSYNLKKIELDVLFFLYSYEQMNTAKDICTYKCLSKAHVSKAIESLSAQRYLATCPNQTDRRCVQLSITERAVPIMDEMSRIWKNLESCLYSGVEAVELEVFQEVWNKIAANMNRIISED